MCKDMDEYITDVSINMPQALKEMYFLNHISCGVDV